jgi:hypothetical protein
VDNVRQRLVAVAVEPGVEEAGMTLAGAHVSGVQVRDYGSEGGGGCAVARVNMLGRRLLLGNSLGGKRLTKFRHLLSLIMGFPLTRAATSG